MIEAENHTLPEKRNVKMHTIIMKRMTGLLLCAVLLCGIPMTGYAAQVKTEEPVQPVSEQRTVALQLAPDSELPDNGELFAQFVEQKLYLCMFILPAQHPENPEFLRQCRYQIFARITFRTR